SLCRQNRVSRSGKRTARHGGQSRKRGGTLPASLSRPPRRACGLVRAHRLDPHSPPYRSTCLRSTRAAAPSDVDGGGRGMAAMSAFACAQPLILFGLLALPVIWWLLRMTPPRPTVELFPPLRILASVLKSEETPHKSPWWLTLLRLMLAGLVILALAEPVHNPRASLHEGGGALAIAMDNGWAATPDWDQRVATARRLIEEAARSNNPVL